MFCPEVEALARQIHLLDPQQKKPPQSGLCHKPRGRVRNALIYNAI
jgi:hypothetical protein